MPSLTWNGPNIFLTSDKFGGRSVLHIYKPIHSKDTIGTAQATSTVRCRIILPAACQGSLMFLSKVGICGGRKLESEVDISSSIRPYGLTEKIILSNPRYRSIDVYQDYFTRVT